MQKWGISIAWPLETGGEKSFEERRGTLDRDDNEPWEGGREVEGWLHVSFPYLSPNGGCSSYKGGSQLLFSLRIKARSLAQLPPAYWHLVLGIFPLP